MIANGEAPSRTPAAPLVQREGPLATGEKFRPFALAGLTVVLVGLCVWLTVPFLPAVTWGVAFAVIAWPLHDWITRRITGNDGWAAIISSLGVVALIVVPGVFVTYSLMQEAESVADRAQAVQAESSVHDRMAQTPGLAKVVGWADRVQVDIDGEVRKAVRSVVADGAGLAQGSIMATFQAFIAFFILFYLLRDRAHVLRAVRRLLPMTRAESDKVFEGAADSVYANLYATLVTSVIDGVGGGLLFWLLGLPSPVMWGVVMFVLSFLPLLGTFVVWMPAAAYLIATGHWGGAVGLVSWGVASWVVVDSIIYVRIAGDRMQLHQVPSLLAFVGGLALFGAAGMVLGPGILAVTVAVLDVWRRRSEAATEQRQLVVGGLS